MIMSMIIRININNLMSVWQKTLDSRFIHQLYDINNMSLESPYKEKSFNTKVLVEKEMLRIESAHNGNHFFSEFEVGIFKSEVVSWGNIENEAEVDVDDVATFIDEYVAVMPVFDLENVADDGVACLRLDE